MAQFTNHLNSKCVILYSHLVSIKYQLYKIVATLRIPRYFFISTKIKVVSGGRYFDARKKRQWSNLSGQHDFF